MLGPGLLCLPRARGPSVPRSGTGAGPGAGPCLAPAGLGAGCPLRPQAPAARHCRGHQWAPGHGGPFCSPGPFCHPGCFSSPPCELGTYLGKVGLCSSASPPSRCWAGHGVGGTAAQSWPCTPRAPLLCCLFPAPRPFTPISLQALGSPSPSPAPPKPASCLTRALSGGPWAPCWSLPGVS